MHNTRRGQIELWMLTKMAMLFFIVALAMVITGFATQEKKTTCAAQASAVAQSITGAISQVVNAPAEDERKVFPLEPTLSIGSAEFSTYVIFVSDHHDTANSRKFISVSVQGRDRDCTGGDSVAYPISVVSGLTSDDTALRSQQLPVESGFLLEQSVCSCRSGTLTGDQCRIKGTACNAATTPRIMQVFPSVGGASSNQRAYYLVALKCREKQIPGPGRSPDKHLFVQACTKAKPEECIDFTSGDIKQVCDWPASA